MQASCVCHVAGRDRLSHRVEFDSMEALQGRIPLPTHHMSRIHDLGKDIMLSHCWGVTAA